MIRSVRMLILALGVVMPLALVAPSAMAFEPPGGAVFNNPAGGHDARWRIVRTVGNAIRNAKPGSTIMISTFLMDDKRSADSLIAARNRGVHVQIVMDGDDAFTGQGRRMAKAMNADNGKGSTWGEDDSYVVFCQGSCRGGEHNDHAKFYLFTHTGTAHDVTMVSSSNLNKGGAFKGWNDMWIVKNRADVIGTYGRIHAEMAQDTSRDGDGFVQAADGQYLSRFYPKHAGSDPVLDDLQKVRCTGATGGAGRGGHTLINVAMFAWNNTRGMDIAKRLVALDKRGCDVKIIYGAPSKVIREYLSHSARNGVVKLWDSRFDRNGDGFYDIRVHHKFVLVNGAYGGDSSSWEVHMGSQNWGRGTLRGGDENTMNIASHDAYAQYLREWNHVKTYAARRIGR